MSKTGEVKKDLEDWGGDVISVQLRKVRELQLLEMTSVLQAEAGASRANPVGNRKLKQDYKSKGPLLHFLLLMELGWTEVVVMHNIR